MSKYASNQERTAEYLQKFDRVKTLKYLIEEQRPVIMDVGANNGSSLVEFKEWWPAAQVHCFEPQRECWDELEAIARSYGPGEAAINRCAAGNRAQETTFYSHDISSGISGFNKVNLHSVDSIHLQRVTSAGAEAVEEYASVLNHERSVEIMRLDSYMAARDIEHVQLLKIDTQGYEPEVLDGLGDKLAAVDVVLTELMFYDYYERRLSFSDIEKFLLPAGFRLYDISHIAKNPMNGRTDWVDVIYVNEQIRTR